MANATTAPGMPLEQARGLNVALWIAQWFLAVTFVGTAIWKLVTPIPELAAAMPWMGEVEPSFLYATAAADLIVGLGVVLPALTRFMPGLVVGFACAGAALMLAAIVFHLTRDEGASTPFNVLLLALALFVAWGRRAKAPIPERARPVNEPRGI